MPSTQDYLSLSQAAYTQDGQPVVAPPGWNVIAQSTINADGFQGVAFQNAATGEIVIAYQGTNPGNSAIINGQGKADVAITLQQSLNANTKLVAQTPFRNRNQRKLLDWTRKPEHSKRLDGSNNLSRRITPSTLSLRQKQTINCTPSSPIAKRS